MVDYTVVSVLSQLAASLGAMGLMVGVRVSDGQQQTPRILPVQQIISAHPRCPVDLNQLLTELVVDLPAYANRVITRSPPTNHLQDIPTSVILATSLPPETIPVSEHLPTDLPTGDDIDLGFILTRERLYINNRMLVIQRYHWLFLRSTPNGWELVKMLSKSDPYPGYRILPQPWDSSQSAIARAIRLWLRDCQWRTVPR
ncbi:MAG: hypothetical protein P5702_06875 [Limnospira sp. PMC 1291.21]|uniref:Uncharacterized protein n=2 Tax=Limnospira TaxID=2596745 RepID=B5W446_LIMMA|nr:MULTISPECIES: hypothetical protein [Limnospira]EKD08297.1 hypothetical protein SPLC1_S260690 [Arthrospira platensis C1]MDC0837290.1 hypothetical protein [Limnoraphis robusta]MDY7052880.1 hypothetical protein [Limnospira fusiformis LS22]QJB25139.1 hypothetical protein HFV01_04180 [Limnospira fusiformis SAG 85.79]EDZ93769.1 hypothetical protein AmaxDRAFT_3544 [Limnospira maxima CS-328]